MSYIETRLTRHSSQLDLGLERGTDGFTASCCQDLEHRLRITVQSREPAQQVLLSRLRCQVTGTLAEKAWIFPQEIFWMLSKHISELKGLHVCDDLSLFKHARGTVSKD